MVHSRDEVNLEPNRVVPISFKIKWPIRIRQTGPLMKIGLIGICLDTDTCYLFHVYHIEELPTSLVQLLTHDNVILISNTITQYIWLHSVLD